MVADMMEKLWSCSGFLVQADPAAVVALARLFMR
jgi:hypothetical protein